MKTRHLVSLGLVTAMLSLVSVISAADSPRERARPGSGAPRPGTQNRLFLGLVAKGELLRISPLLETDPALITAVDRDGRTALHLAPTREIAELLIAAKADVNARAENGQTPLAVAAAAGNLDIVTLLLDAKADVNLADNAGRTALDAAETAKKIEIATLLRARGAVGASSAAELFAAVIAGDLETIRRLLALAPQLIEAKDASGKTMLIVAAGQGNEAAVDFLLQNKASLNATTPRGDTALMWAVGNKRIGTAKLLLAAGADVNARDSVGQTALAQCPRDKILTALLIDNEADVTVRSKSGGTPMHNVALYGSSDVADLLLAAGADVNARNTDLGSTPLFGAIVNKNADMVQWLLAHGADLNAVEADGDTPVHQATTMGTLDFLVLLIDHGANPNAANQRGLTPLELALSFPNYSTADLLRSKGATGGPSSHEIFQALAQRDHARLQRVLAADSTAANLMSQDGVTPLLAAADMGDAAAVKLLVDAHATLSAQAGNGGDTALHLAVKGKHADIVAALLAAGADVNARDLDDGTPLHYAAALGEIPIAEALLTAHADINAPAIQRLTPLHIALSEDQFEMAKWLLAHGADPAAESEVGEPYYVTNDNTPPDLVALLKPAGLALHEAAVSGNLAAAQAAIARDAAAVRWKDKAGITPLHQAAFHGHRPIVEALLAAKANANDADNEGHTPLAYVCTKSKDATIAGLLLAAGADMNAKGKDGVLPLDFAVATGAFEIADLLRSKGATGRPSSGEIFQTTRMDDLTRLQKLLRDRKVTKAKDEFGRTPLIYAVAYGKLEAAKALLNAGADVNAADDKGETVLHHAVRAANVAIIDFLLTKKVAVNARAKDGQTPLDFAYTSGGKKDGAEPERIRSERPADKPSVVDFLQIAALLESKGAKQSKDLGPMKP